MTGLTTEIKNLELGGGPEGRKKDICSEKGGKKVP